jgi:hypothetical protein
MIQTKTIRCVVCKKTFEYILDGINDDKRYIEEFGWKYNSMKSRWSCPDCIEKEKSMDDLEFVEHLNKSSAIVNTWPEWKKTLFGKTVSI